MSRYKCPVRSDFDTEEEYLEEMAYYEQAENLRELQEDDNRYFQS